MSADNGIYILPSKHGSVFVAHMQSVENLTYKPDRVDGYNSAEVIRFMCHGKQCATMHEACEYAQTLSKEYTILEYGVCLLEPLSV